LSNLDATLREEMRFEIRRLHDEFRVTTVYVTHDQAEAMVTSDRIAVMNHGRIEQVDHPRALYNTPKTRFVWQASSDAPNFIEGTSDGHEISFAALRCRAPHFGRDVPSEGKAVFSVRRIACGFQTCHQPPGTAAPRSESSFFERAFLGGALGLRCKVARGRADAEGYDLTLDDFPIGAAAGWSLNRVRWRRSPEPRQSE